MKKLLVVLLLLLVAAAVAAELIAPQLVEARLEERVAAETRQAAGVEANVESFPFLPGIALDGEIRRLSLTLEEVGGQRIPLASVQFALEGLRLNRQALFDGEVKLTGIDSGLVTVELGQDAISEALGGVPVEITSGGVALRPGGGAVEADVVTRGQSVALTASGMPGLEVAMPEDLMPCAPQVESGEGVVRLTCTIQEIPPVLVRAVAG